MTSTDTMNEPATNGESEQIQPNTADAVRKPVPPVRPVAVIDIGVTSIRMAIAEIDGAGFVRTLETMIQSVNLGRDVFDNRRLRRASIEKSAAILIGYRKILREYGIEDTRDIRVVATTAVREASNALAFTDRIFVATGLTVDPIDEAEVNRITYVAVMPHLREHSELYDNRTVVVEVGGGTTELLVIRSGNVLHSGSFRLGSLRSLRALEEYRAGASRRRGMLESHVRRTLGQLTESIRRDTSIELLALGGDVRFAAHYLIEDWDGQSLAKIPTSSFVKFANRVIGMDADLIVKRYGASFIEAETLAPALLVYRILVEEFSLEHVYVGDTNLRDGLLHDLARDSEWSAEFGQQIIRSAISLGRRFDFDETHARNVSELARSLFEQLTLLHGLSSRHEVLLSVAALLHEIGMAVNTRSNHKHAMYLIRHSDVFGMSREDLLLVALVVRYHRRAYPQPTHEGLATLNQSDRVIVAKLAAILRLAISLDDRRTGRIRRVTAVKKANNLIVTAGGVDDVSLEQVAMRENSGLFKDVFGLTVSLKTG